MKENKYITRIKENLNKKDRLEDEANELEAFIKPESELEAVRKKAESEEAEKEELILLLKSVMNVVEVEMKYDFPDSYATRRLEGIVNKFKYEHLNKPE